MTTKVNGKNWQAQTLEGTSDGTALYLTGTASDGSRIDIYLANGGQGSTIIAGGNSGLLPENFIRYVEPGLNLTFLSTFKDKFVSGEIIITEIDKANQTVSGTFFSDLTDMYQGKPDLTASNGKISKVRYQFGEIDYQKPEVPLSIAFAKVNGIPKVFAPFSIKSGAGSIEPKFWNKKENKFLSVSFPFDVSEGSYDLGSSYSSYFATFQNGNATSDSELGILNITSHVIGRHRVHCTFNFTSGSDSNMVSITDGVIGMTY
jgi:hypothetical protein